MTHSLTLGSLLLTDSLPDDEHDFVFNVLADGLGFGVAKGVQEVVTSLLADGDLVRTRRHGNRDVTFAVEITGPSLASLAQGEAALRREVGRSNTLTWQAPDTFAVPTVFEVVDSEMSQTFNDLDELGRRRTFNVTLTCSPFARSFDLVTVPAMDVPAETPTTTVVNGANSTTGWTATVTKYSRATQFTTEPVAPEGVAGGVSFTTSGTNLQVTATQTVALSGTPYVVIDMAGPPPAVFKAQVIGGVHTFPLIMTRATSYGTVQYVLHVGNTTVFDVRLFWSSPDPFGNRPWSVTVYDITATDTLPVVSSHQVNRAIATGGTERTPASIEVAARVPGQPLNLAIVHTSPQVDVGYSPALRHRRISGNTVTGDSTLMSGAREPVNATPVVAAIPLLSMPQDQYALVALMRSNTAGTFSLNWQARTFFDSEYLGGVSGVATATFLAPGAWTVVAIDVVTLPPVRASEAEAYIQLDLSRSPVGSEVIDLDEWWAFRDGNDCALTMVYSTTAAYLWLDSPDVTSAVPRLWIGADADRTDSRHPGGGLLAQGNHTLHPEGTSIFVATSGIQYPAVSATYHRRWHSNAAE